MTRIFYFLSLLLICIGCINCSSLLAKIPVVLDTDANNEVDDQHAMAYLFMNGKSFDVKGVTVHTTKHGGNINSHYAEAVRVVQMCNVVGVPTLKGADGNFEAIAPTLDKPDFDGHEAVNFIIIKSKEMTNEKLVLLAVGKLTNVALAVKKDPSITDKIRLVWLGANYPDAGEYNLENDIASMNYLLETDIEFEIVTVRYGQPSGTAAVIGYKADVLKKMPGKGPVVEPVTGRHGKKFTTFGDYSVNLFENCHNYTTPPGRPLFDMAAVAIVKNPAWAEVKTIPAPTMVNEKWVNRPDNKRTVKIWENFAIKTIMDDFYHTMDNYTLIEVK